MLWRKPVLLILFSISSLRGCLMEEQHLFLSSLIWFNGVGSGSSIYHTSGKALPDSTLSCTCFHPAWSCLAAPRCLWQAQHTGGSTRNFFWTASLRGWSTQQSTGSGSIPSNPCQHPSPLKKRVVGHGRECWLLVYKGLDEAILQKQSRLYNFFGSVQSTREKTASQGNFYQLRADCMVETFSTDMPVCQGQVPLWLLLRLYISGAYPCFHLSCLSS